MINLWQSLGRKEAFTWVSVAYLLLQQFNGVTISNLPLNLSGKLWLFVVAVIVPFIFMAALFVIGRYLLNPLLPEYIRPIITLIIFEAAIVLRLWTFTGLLVAFDISPENQFLLRFPTAQVNQMLGLVVIAYLVSSAREYAQHNELLVRSLDNLQSSQQDVYERLNKRKRALINGIRAQLSSELDTVAGIDADRDAEKLKSLIEDVVRPLTQRLNAADSIVTSALTTFPSTRFRVGPLVSRTVKENPFYPVFFLLWTFLPSLATGAGYLGFDSLPYVLMVNALFFITIGIAKMLWRLVPRSTYISLRILLISLIPLPLALISNWFIQLVSEASEPDKTLTYYVYFFTVIWAIALVVASRNMLRKTNESLQTATTNLTRQLVHENAEARLFERRVALFLHGPVQDAIAASLKRVQAHPQGTQLSEDDISAIRRPIDTALSHLDDSDTDTTDAYRGITDLAELWKGVVEIQLDLNPEALTLLSESPAVSSIVIELVREALSNAIRHGDAQNISIALDGNQHSQDLQITVRNDGKPISSEAVQGIGTSLFDSMSLSWSRKNVDKQVVVTAVVPLIHI